MKGSIRKRCDDGEARKINAGFDGEFGGFQKDLRVIIIQTEDEASLQGYAVVMENFDDASKSFWRVETFVAISKVCWGDGFQAHEQAFAPTTSSQIQQF